MTNTPTQGSGFELPASPNTPIGRLINVVPQRGDMGQVNIQASRDLLALLCQEASHSESVLHDLSTESLIPEIGCSDFRDLAHLYEFRDQNDPSRVYLVGRRVDDIARVEILHLDGDEIARRDSVELEQGRTALTHRSLATANDKLPEDDSARWEYIDLELVHPEALAQLGTALQAAFDAKRHAEREKRHTMAGWLGALAAQLFSKQQRNSFYRR